METPVVKSGPSVSFMGLLFLLLLGLKLGGVINWSWWWVTAPLWGPFALVMAVVVILFFVAMIFNWLGNIR